MGRDLEDFLDLLGNDCDFRRAVAEAENAEAIILLAEANGLTLMEHEAKAFQTATRKYLQNKRALNDKELDKVSGGSVEDVFLVKEILRWYGARS